MNPVPFATLQLMSGYSRPSAVCRWLQKNGIPFVKGARGEPATTEEAIANRIERGIRRGAANSGKTPGINYGAVGSHVKSKA